MRDIALRRIDQGDYGDCFECGREIAEAHLRALPFAVRCRDCEAVREAIDRRERSTAYRDPSDLTARTTSADEVNGVFVEEASSERYRGILGVTTDPIVSSDIIKDPRASIVDLGMTQVVDGDLLEMMSWYDNEWGYSSQLVRAACRIASKIEH